MTLSNESQHESSMHSRLHRNAQIKSTCFTVYLLFNSRYQISHRCFISWRVIFRTLHSSNIRSITRSHVSQIDLTSYLKSTDLSNLDSFVSALFASMYDLALQNLRHWENLHESFRIRIAEKALEVTSLRESADSNDSHSHVSINQDLSNWKSLLESFKILVVEKASELVVEKACTKASNISALNRRFRQMTQTIAVRECWKDNIRNDRCSRVQLI